MAKSESSVCRKAALCGERSLSNICRLLRLIVVVVVVVAIAILNIEMMMMMMLLIVVHQRHCVATWLASI